MTMWFTSDLHFNHKNVIGYSNRPFTDVDHMNTVLINNFNSSVQPNDTVVFVGDVCMGSRIDTLPLLKRMNGFKILVPGNHDYCHPMHGDHNYDKWQTHKTLYEEYFDDIIYDKVYLIDNFVVCHFPYDINGSDHADREFGDYEPLDMGMPLICGHVHNEWKIKASKNGTFMINVGVDVHNYFPVSLESIQESYHRFVYK